MKSPKRPSSVRHRPALTLAVCVLDNHHAGTTAAFMDRRTAELAVAESARRGYLDGRALAGVFAWLRPTDCQPSWPSPLSKPIPDPEAR